VDLDITSSLTGAGFTSAFDTRLNATTTLDLTTLDVTTITLTNDLAVAQGGTGASTLSSGDLLVGNGTSAVTSTS